MPNRDVVRQLATLADTMKDVVAKLTRINAEWADPPDPDKPAIRGSLGDIKTAAASASSIADQILGRL